MRCRIWATDSSLHTKTYFSMNLVLYSPVLISNAETVLFIAACPQSCSPCALLHDSRCSLIHNELSKFSVKPNHKKAPKKKKTLHYIAQHVNKQ